MKKNLFLLILLAFYTLHSHAQWTSVTPPSGTLNVYSVFAITDNAVAIAGDAKVSRTIDGGLNWTTPLTITGALIYEVHSPEPTHWYSLTRNSTWFIKMGNPAGVVASSGKPDSILSLHFMTGSCGVAVGIGGKIEATCDTGTTWQLRSSATTASLNAVWFADPLTGCACGSFGKITRTQDGGATWDTVSSTVTVQLNGIHFPNATTGYIVGNSGTFLKSTDAGATWTSITTGLTNHLNGVYFQDADTGYIAGTSGLIKKSTDGGLSWITMTTPTTQTLNSIHFATTSVGWAVGNNATILKLDMNTSCSVSANIISNVLCYGGNDGSAYATPSGGAAPYTYLWTPTSQTGQTATNLPAGTYTVSVTDSAGCNTLTTVSITEPTSLTANSSTINNVSCFNGNNGSATVNPSGGVPSYAYLWTPSGQTGQTATNLFAGSYTVTVTDGNGCTITSTATITQTTALTAVGQTINNVSCFNGNDGCVAVTPGGGTPGYTYSWSPSGGNGATACNLTAGTCTVTVTDINGCSITATATVSQPSQLTLNVNTTDASCSSCSDGSAYAIVGGGTWPYTYSWIPIGANTPTVSNLPPGNYTCCVTDANGCSVCQSDSVSFPTTTNEIGSDEIDFNIYPNPSHNSFTISLAGSLSTVNSHLSIYDITGRIVHQQILTSAHHQIMNHFSPGIYFVKVSDGEKVLARKVMIE
jgi:hypothetical protein